MSSVSSTSIPSKSMSTCDICSKSMRADTLKRHMKTHTSDKSTSKSNKMSSKPPSYKYGKGLRFNEHEMKAYFLIDLSSEEIAEIMAKWYVLPREKLIYTEENRYVALEHYSMCKHRKSWEMALAISKTYPPDEHGNRYDKGVYKHTCPCCIFYQWCVLNETFRVKKEDNMKKNLIRESIEKQRKALEQQQKELDEDEEDEDVEHEEKETVASKKTSKTSTDGDDSDEDDEDDED